MARAGRKRKEGLRQPSGRLPSRPTMATLNAMNAAKTEEVTAVARNQPHRLGSDDRWMGSAVGRFCRAAGCREAIYNACQEYAEVRAKWDRAIETPRGYESPSDGGTTAGPSAAQVARWHRRVTDVEIAITERCGVAMVGEVYRLVIEDRDPGRVGEVFRQELRAALGVIAVVTGHLTHNPHPFR